MIADHNLVKKSFDPMIADHDLVKKRKIFMGAEVRLNFQVKIVFTQNWCNIT
jgi:hypothetical protein